MEIDSIRTFDAGSQRSLEKVQVVDIPPAREWIATQNEFQETAVKVEQYLAEHIARVKDSSVKEKLNTNIKWEIEQLKQGHYFSGLYKYISTLYKKGYTLFDYIATNSVIIFDEASRINEVSKQAEREVQEWQLTLLNQGELLPSLLIYQSFVDMMNHLHHQKLYLSLFLRQVPHVSPQNIVNFVTRNMQNFHGQMHVLKAEMERWRKMGTGVVFLAADQERAKRLQRVLYDYEVEVDMVSSHVNQLTTRPIILEGNLQSGFEMASIHLSLITEGEVFPRSSVKQGRECNRTIQSELKVIRI